MKWIKIKNRKFLETWQARDCKGFCYLIMKSPFPEHKEKPYYFHIIKHDFMYSSSEDKEMFDTFENAELYIEQWRSLYIMKNKT